MSKVILGFILGLIITTASLLHSSFDQYQAREIIQLLRQIEFNTRP